MPQTSPIYWMMLLTFMTLSWFVFLSSFETQSFSKRLEATLPSITMKFWLW